MNTQTDILSIAHKSPLMQEDLDVLLHVDRAVPGSVHYSINRYKKNPSWNIDDTGILVYHYEKNNPTANYLELKFCVSGNLYCKQKQTECDFCKFNASKTCAEKVESVDVLSFSFSPNYLTQFKKSKKEEISNSPKAIYWGDNKNRSRRVEHPPKPRQQLQKLTIR